MKKLLINITEELHQVLETIAERLADEACGETLAKYPYLRETKVGPLIEQLLRSHPAVDLIREELGIEWADRRSPGWELGKSRTAPKKRRRKAKI